jgi:2-aminoadipate transaminase
MQTLWEKRYAQRTQRITSSAIREILKITQQPDVISFAGGLPSPDVFPIPQFKDAYDVVLSEQGAQALQYSATEGYQPLRIYLAEYTQKLMNIKLTADNILIVSGSQQLMDLVGKIFIDPGDNIIVETPTYMGAIQAWKSYQAEFIPVATDENGMIPESLEENLRAVPKFIYALPNFQNPTGISYSLERRKSLVQLSNHYGVPILEDDPYGRLRYYGEHLPNIITLDNEHNAEDCKERYCGNVIYTSTFSKTLAPGVRLAWVVAPEQVIAKLVQAKQGVDLHTATITQMTVYNMIKDSFFEGHIEEIQSAYKRRRDLMLSLLEKHFPPEVKWTRPLGGLFLWVTLPEDMSSSDLLEIAVNEKRVAFVPGGPFYPTGGGENTFRMNFSNASDEGISEGVKRIGELLQERI